MNPLGDCLPFGAQYYRAPTPLSTDWERDLDTFKSAGFNTIKIWAQWRWNNPDKGEYYFDDLDRLMNIAAERGIEVVINTIFDCAPAWLFNEYPDCRMVTADGRKLGPVVTAYRQIGGVPGPCLNHPVALNHRMDFLKATVERYADHPALYIWDLWNEPELTCGLMREAKIENQVCYCEHCRALFVDRLKEQHGDLDGLNGRWQRNYRSWDEVELPVSPSTFGDVIDWRTFHIETITREMRCRAEVTRQFDKTHPVMCHTVPMPVFNPVTCASDDWDLAAPCDLFGNSLGSMPFAGDMIGSAAGNKPVINAEIHALPGTSLSRPKPLRMDDMKRHIFVPLARGIKGFLFWQYRPEALGLESPAWGLTRPDGSPTPWMEHAATINGVLQSMSDFILSAEPSGPKVGVLYNPSSHLFAWCAGGMEIFDDALRGVYNALYAANCNVRFLHTRHLTSERLDGLKIIIYPFPYAMDNETAQTLRDWVSGGGVLISEAFFGNLEMETSPHSSVVPGYGFDKVFGAVQGIEVPFTHEADVYARDRRVDLASVFGPRIKADLGKKTPLEAQGFMIRIPLETTSAKVAGQFYDGSAAITVNGYGKGKAVLCGTLISTAAAKNHEAAALIAAMIDEYDIRPRAKASDNRLRIDILSDATKNAIILHNSSMEEIETDLILPPINNRAKLRNQLTGEEILPHNNTWRVCVAPDTAELYTDW